MKFESLVTHLPDADWGVVSPGRVNLLGEHVDYNQGLVLPAAIERCVMVAAKPRFDRQVVLRALDMGAEARFSLDDLVARVDMGGKPLPRWALYPAGVAWALRNAGFDPQGVEAVYASNLPIGAGLSSSAAVEVAFAVLWQVIGGWELSRMRLAQICQMAENRYVGVNCGLMDQFTCTHGVARHALFFDVRSLEWQPLPLPPDTAIVIADSGVRRQLADSAYNRRRADCEEAVRLLREHLPGINSLRDVSIMDFNQHSSGLPEEIRLRAKHVIEEIERVRQAGLCLAREDAIGFGRLMNEGHASLRDLFQVSTPELNALVDIAQGLDGCYGARLTGAGFGGCTVNLVDSTIAKIFADQLKEDYFQKTSHRTEAIICAPARGAYCESLSA
jgi:galactokinase